MSVPRKSGSPAKPRKSSLRVAAFPAGISRLSPARPAAEMTGEQFRSMMISEFCQWLRSRSNQEKRPFQEETITAYAVAARALDAWMAKEDIEGDFTACDAAVLNRFFRDYHAGHRQNGTNTKHATSGTCSRGWRQCTTTRTRTPTS
jgi:hypothetical protein